MADVKISELAKTVGVSVDKLLSQIKEAGLPHAKSDELISNDDKNTLLVFLRRSHGDREATSAAPKKITLKRKTVGTLKSASTHGRGKTVNVEVRKKRTYVKRAAVDSPELELPPSDVEVEAEAAAPLEEVVEAQNAKDPVDSVKAKELDEQVEASAPAPEVAVVPAENKDTPEILHTEADATKAGKHAPKRKATVREDADDPIDKKKSHLRKKAKSQVSKRQNKTIHVNDDFVLEGDDFDEMGSRGRRGSNRKTKARLSAQQHAFEKPTEFISREIIIGETNSLADLAQKMSIKSGEMIKSLFNMGVMATINQVLDQDTSILLIEEMGHKAKFISQDAIEEELADVISSESGKEEILRAPVVTVMGHVDHGKTSLLDYIRKESVAAGEAGGITQHIGAYHVETERGMVSFLDTPGHAAFSAMRSRGAKATDVIVLVVAADDGVKPQTEEAVQHAKASDVPLVVAINKMDKEGADPDRAKNELSAMEVIPEDWGGDVQFIEVSAITGMGIENLLEAILLQAELLELHAYTDVPGQGVVIESRLDKGRGPVASVLVQNGTLKQGDIIVAGEFFGRARALNDEAGKSVKYARPATPVSILGLNGTPNAGDSFIVAKDEKRAREVAEFRAQRATDVRLRKNTGASLDSLLENFGADEVKLLNVIVKADVRGSLEAIVTALGDIGNDEVQVNVVMSGVGGITESDATYAVTAKAVVFGFNVRADNAAKKVIEAEGLDLRYYKVIYDLVDDVKAALSGMLSPEVRESIVGIAEVKEVFESKKLGQIAGSIVTEGTVSRSKKIRVLRDNVVIYEGELESLRRFKDEVQDVSSGTECGIGVKDYNDVKRGDQIEVFNTSEVARQL